MKRHYGAKQMVFSAAGNIDHDDLVQRVSKGFTNLTPDCSHSLTPARYQGGDYRQDKELEQVHVLLGFEGVPYGHKDYYALSVLSTIVVQNEYKTGYSRSFFKHWIDANGNGCDTREEVLIAESQSKAQVDAFGCKVFEGDWLSPYDNVMHTNPSDLDIDHMVPLKEAWDSGAWNWTAAQRQTFANDLSDPRALIAVTVGQNRSKSDRDPSNWIPPQKSYVCTYLSEWVAIKARWNLSMDQSEFGRIKNLLTASCATVMVAQWGNSPWRPNKICDNPTDSYGASCHRRSGWGNRGPRGEASSMQESRVWSDRAVSGCPVYLL
jgi:hypothetical protein